MILMEKLRLIILSKVKNIFIEQKMSGVIWKINNKRNFFMKEFNTLDKLDNIFKNLPKWKTYTLPDEDGSEAIPLAYLRSLDSKKFEYALSAFELMVKNGLNLDDTLKTYILHHGDVKTKLFKVTVPFSTALFTLNSLTLDFVGVDFIKEVFKIYLKHQPDQVETFFTSQNVDISIFTHSPKNQLVYTNIKNYCLITLEQLKLKNNLNILNNGKPNIL